MGSGPFGFCARHCGISYPDRSGLRTCAFAKASPTSQKSSLRVATVFLQTLQWRVEFTAAVSNQRSSRQSQQC